MPTRPEGHVRQASVTKVSTASFHYVNLHHQPIAPKKEHQRQTSAYSASDLDSSSPRSSSDSCLSSITSLGAHSGNEKTSSNTEEKYQQTASIAPLASLLPPSTPLSALPLSPRSEEDAEQRWSRIMTDLGVTLNATRAISSPQGEEEEVTILGYQEEGVDSDSDTEPLSPSKRTSELPYRRPTYSWIELDKDKRRSSAGDEAKDRSEEMSTSEIPTAVSPPPPRRPLPAVPTFRPSPQPLAIRQNRREASIHSQQSSLVIPSRICSPHPVSRTPSPAPSSSSLHTESSLPPHLRPLPRSRPRSRNSMTFIYRDPLPCRSNSPQLLANVKSAHADAKGYQITDNATDRRSKRASLVSVAPSVVRNSIRNSVVHQSGENSDKRRSFYAGHVPSSDPFDRQPVPSQMAPLASRSLPKRRYKPPRKRVLQPSKNTASFFATRTRAWDMYEEPQSDHQQQSACDQPQPLPYVQPESHLPPDLYHRASTKSLHHTRTPSATSLREILPRPPSSSGYSHHSHHSRAPSAIFMTAPQVQQQVRNRPSMVSITSRQSAIMSSFAPTHQMAAQHGFDQFPSVKHYREQVVQNSYSQAEDPENALHRSLSRATPYHAIDPLPQLTQNAPHRRRTLRKRRKPIILRAQKQGIFSAMFGKRKNEMFEPLYIPSQPPRHPSRLF